MRDNTRDFKKIEVHWEAVKSLLDSSPKLWNRAEEYVVVKCREALIRCHVSDEPDIEKLTRRILMEYEQ